MFSIKQIYFLILIGCFLTISSCQWDPKKYSNPRLIVCTTTIIGDMVNQLLGEKFEVKTLMGAGVDPHMYEAKPSDVRALGEASVIISNGLHLEGKMSELFKRLESEKDVIYFSDGMSKNKLIRLNAHSFDPHVWFDVELWLSGFKNCARQLMKIYPQDTEFIQRNYLRIETKLKRLNESVKKQINTIDPSKRILITSHDAFHYFGKAYGVNVKALQGVSTVTEPGVLNVSNLVDYIVLRKIPAVFIESSVSVKSIKSVIENCKQRGHQLKIGGMMYSDALGGKGSNAETYQKMILKNIYTFSLSMK